MRKADFVKVLISRGYYKHQQIEDRYCLALASNGGITVDVFSPGEVVLHFIVDENDFDGSIELCINPKSTGEFVKHIDRLESVMKATFNILTKTFKKAF